MKKEDVTGLLLYLVIFAVAIVYGLVVLQPYFAKSTFQLGIIYALFILGAIVVGILTSAILLELGHILGAKIGGYNILSVNILHFLFYKEEGKTKFRFSNFDGLTGETKIMPKSEKSKPKAYLLMGTLFLALWITGAVIIFYINKDYVKTTRSDMAYFFLTVAVVCGIALFYNIFPAKLDALNDGYRLAMVSNPKNSEAFNELLRVEYEIGQGKEDIEIKTFTDLTNFTADLNMNKVYIALDKKEYDEADKLLDLVLANKENVSHRVYLRALSMKVYISFVSKEREEAINYVNDNFNIELRKEICDDSNLISIRAYVLISGLVDNSKSECYLALGKVYKAYKHTPKNRKEQERNLYNTAIDMVIEAHPKWELENYKLEEETKK
ncbi:MAG: hypothetical protein K5925_02925 [Bacilli bacterium]|nr:hypothetical protein [Bacilli bacterium]